MPDIAAVVVTYHPDERALANIALLRKQVERIIVVDNTADATSCGLLAPLRNDPAIEVIFNERNQGVATALNQGAQRARALGCPWVGTFDQDSQVPAGYIAGLLAAYAAHPQRARVAVLAPLYRDRYLGFIYSPAGSIRLGDAADALVNVTATSGNLVSVRALEETGYFREDFFIDCLDFEFCLRCRRTGWLILEVRRVVLEHTQGRWEQRRFLWKHPRFNDYPAVRRYYQIRNRLPLYVRYALFDPRWVARDAWGQVCDLTKMMLFCPERSAKLGAIVRGFWHGAVGRMGPWQP